MHYDTNLFKLLCQALKTCERVFWVYVKAFFWSDNFWKGCTVSYSCLLGSAKLIQIGSN